MSTNEMTEMGPNNATHRARRLTEISTLIDGRALLSRPPVHSRSVFPSLFVSVAPARSPHSEGSSVVAMGLTTDGRTSTLGGL